MQEHGIKEHGYTEESCNVNLKYLKSIMYNDIC